MIEREPVNIEAEYLLLGNMVMNDEVLSACHARHKAGELKTRHFTQHYRPVARWLFKFYSDFNKAPRRTIQEIFEQRKRGLKEEAREMVAEALDRVADEYEEGEVDIDYIKHEVLINFIRERELSDRAEKVLNKIDQGNPEEAEKILKEYSIIEPEEDEETITLHAMQTAKEHFKNPIGNEADRAFMFDGDVGYIVGPLERSWLVAITGIEKIGKSYLLGEIAHQAAYYHKKKVLTINLELDKRMVVNRGLRRLSITANVAEAGRMVSPILDCRNNQEGTCALYDKKPLFQSMGQTILYRRNRSWKICNRCRGKASRKNAALDKRFVPVVWFDSERIDEMTKNRVRRAIRRFKYQGVNNQRVRCFPRFSKTFDETRDYILRYIDKHNWHPDIIVYDYLDILAPETGVRDERIDIDRKWKKASKLAGELNCLVITADQATKASRQQRSLDQMSTSESKTKDAHLDVRIAINQTELEKKQSIARFAVLFHRHASFYVDREILIAQRLATAEALRDNALLLGGKQDHKVFIDEKDKR